jgi:hypothetical protein
MGSGKMRTRLVAAGAGVCVLAALVGLSSAGCGKEINPGRQAAAVGGWNYSTETDAAGHVTQRRAETLAAEELPELGATLALWTDAAGTHVSLASAPGTAGPLACSYEQQFVLARVDGGTMQKVACKDGPGLMLHPALYDRVRSAKEVCLEADTAGGGTHGFRFRVAGLRLRLR